ncbi:MAG: hypothetical protein IT488_10505 [Gammaproteobacteria bacterium]|nr:hypothetical protein [Gammaproteobacteria bacterium]
MKSASKPRKTELTATDPGPLATPEQAQRANQEAYELLQIIYPLNLPHAAAHIRNNPLSPDAIAMLGFLAYRVLTSERNRMIARGPRKSLRQQIRDLGIKRYAEVKNISPELHAKYTRIQLTEAISKAKSKEKIAKARSGK